jgi:hypothetical protein
VTAAMRMVLAAVLGLGVCGCSKDEQVLEFIKENDALVAAIKKTSDPEAARKAFETRKGTLKSKFEALQDAYGFQIERENIRALQKSAQQGVDTICMLAVPGDDAANEKYRILCEDYASVVMKSK